MVASHSVTTAPSPAAQDQRSSPSLDVSGARQVVRMSRGRGRGLRWSARYRRKKYGRLLKRTTQLGAKRVIDIAVSFTLLCALLPFFLLIALLIKLTDRGPVLFWQTRVGRWGHEFQFPKFRSMVPNAEQLLISLLSQNQHKTGVTFKLRRDPRVTWIGRIIRRASIDELPQLWCVLRGQMTLVGPRPAVPREVALYSVAERARLAVTPGLTCIWQISGRGDIPFARQVEMDLEYINNQSLWLDLKIMIRTVPAVLTGRGAY